MPHTSGCVRGGGDAFDKRRLFVVSPVCFYRGVLPGGYRSLSYGARVALLVDTSGGGRGPGTVAYGDGSPWRDADAHSSVCGGEMSTAQPYGEII